MTEAAKAFEDRIKDGPFQKAKPFKYPPCMMNQVSAVNIILPFSYLLKAYQIQQ
ncbi:hypothetical protein [Erwinia billingiae]|uniref:hypothetical protein n=1 Tax=Erwinia billingiae TaxID=182337 RepID=UPI0012FE9370|nr:hypothetical protein [Erwinia billingiae]